MKPGYKQTEVGVIPEEWEESSVGGVCRLINGRGFKPHEWRKTGLPIIRIQNLNGSEDFNYFDGQYAKKLEVENGQLLFAWSGSRGTSFGPHIWNGSLGLLNYHTWKVQVDKRAISPEFFLHALKQLTKFIEDRAHGASALVHTQKWEMEGFTFPMPPTIAEQRAIAEALSDVDALLGALERLIAKKRDLKQAAMQQLLTGQTRLPGFKDKWEMKRLGDLFEITSSKRVFQSDWRSDGIPFYRARELAILGETGRIDNELFITRELYETHRRAYGVPAIGDMLVTGVGTLGKVYVVSDDREFYFKDGNIIWFQIGGKMSAEFLRQLYLTPAVIKQIADGAAGTTVGTYTITAAKRTTIRFPTISEQKAIAEVLSDMDAELAALEQRREKTRALKQGMMQELLTGRTRLV